MNMLKLANINYKIKNIFFKLTFNEKAIYNNKLKIMKKHGIKYGKNLRCFSNILGPESYLITIGDNVTISTDVKFITHDNSVIKLALNGTDVFGKINIGDNCFIGSGSIVLPGVTLANNIIVGAGSIVTKSFNEENIVIGGNPAKKICDIEDFKRKNAKLIHDMTGLDYISKKNYLLQLNDDELIRK